jgi:hypothetical protein
MVYILAANKLIKYHNGRSRILYIGTTKSGASRPAASAVNKASEVFYKLHGINKISVHVFTCAKRQNVQTWKQLEAVLIDEFRKQYFELPRYNSVRPKAVEGLFGQKKLQEIISQFGMS